MKTKLFLLAAVLVLVAGLSTGNAHMSQGGGHMMQEYGGQQEDIPQEYGHHPSMMYPGMMGGYGMGPGMMGGYGMGPGMMGGYGMGPGMMGGYGMGPGMMRGYGMGMGPGMMGGYGFCPGPGVGRFVSPDEFGTFLDDTKELRREMHNLRFEYGEMLRNPESSAEERKNLEKKMLELQQKIQEKAVR
jgi:hypothetical protein